MVFMKLKISFSFPNRDFKVGFLSTLLSLMLIMGCGAYFNTYYNAKKFFNQAEKKRIEREKSAQVSGNQNRRLNRSKIPEYERAIEKGSKVLQFHAKSKYVDDALFLIGRSFYHTYEYLKARRKFDELITIFPEGKLASKSKLWLGKTLIELKEYETALTVLNELVSQKVDKNISGEERFLLGELYFNKEDYPAAIKEFTDTIDKVSKKSDKVTALSKASEAYIKLLDYNKAAQVLRRALDLKPELEQKYLVELTYAKILRQLKEYDQTLLVFDAMTKGALTRNEMANVRLEIANTYIEREEWDKAKITLEEIVVDFPKSEFAVSALFELGKMFIKKDNDLQQAKVYFEAAKKKNKRNAVTDSVKLWLKNVTEWDQIKFEIEILETAYYSFDFTNTDTIGEYIVNEQDESDEFALQKALAQNQAQVNSDSIKQDASNDSTKSSEMEDFLSQEILSRMDEKEKINQLKKDDKNINVVEGSKKQAPNTNIVKKKKASVPKNFNQLENKLISTHNKLAELFLFQFDQPDSALGHYEFLSINFDDNQQAPHWLFMRSSLQQRKGAKDLANSLFQTIIDKYPNTKYSDEASKILGKEVPEKKLDVVELLFTQAEDQLFKMNDVDSSLKLYYRISEDYKESEFAPKAVYAIAWINEWKLSNNDKALEIYEQLIERYPDSELSKQVKIKLNALKIAKKEEERKRKEAAEQIASESAEEDTTNLKIEGIDSESTEEDTTNLKIEEIDSESKKIEELDDIDPRIKKTRFKNKNEAEKNPEIETDPRKKNLKKKDDKKSNPKKKVQPEQLL